MVSEVFRDRPHDHQERERDNESEECMQATAATRRSPIVLPAHCTVNVMLPM